MKLVLVTLFIAAFVMPSNAQSFFKMHVDFPATGCGDYCNPDADLSKFAAIEYSQVVSAYEYISKKSNTQFNYPQGGCPERAVVIHYLLDSMKLPNFRIWVFAPSRLIEGSKEQLFIYDRNSLTTDPENKIYWDFHVAPCVLAKTASGIPDTLVIDPSINATKPLKVQEWLMSIENNKNSKYAFLDGKYYQFNKKDNGSNVINGYFYPYEGYSFENLWVEKMMALNEIAYSLYLKYVKGKDRTSQDIKDLMSVIGNSATFKEVLEYKDGLPSAAKIRILALKYPQFITEAWTLYSEKLVNWAARLQKLKS